MSKVKAPQSSGNKRFYQSKDFHDLQRHWYRMLKKDGFDDIEAVPAIKGIKPAGDGAHKERNIGRFTSRSVMEYFRLARAFAYDHRFDEPWHKTAWSMHAEGASWTDIGRTLGYAAYHIQRVLERYKDRMLSESVPDTAFLRELMGGKGLEELREVSMRRFGKLARTYSVWEEAALLPAQPTPRRGSGT